ISPFPITLFFPLPSAPLSAPPSFPTRRSSDLARTVGTPVPLRGVVPTPNPQGRTADADARTARGTIHRTRRRGNLSVRSSYPARSEEHTSELQSRFDLVCRLLLETQKHTLEEQ